MTYRARVSGALVMLLSAATGGCAEQRVETPLIDGGSVDGGRIDGGSTVQTPDGGTPSTRAAGSCTPDSAAGRLDWKCYGALAGGIGAYDGWSAVERSTPEDLVLLISAARIAHAGELDAGVDPEADAGMDPTLCVLSRYAAPLPVLPAGSRVWLHETHDKDYRGPARMHRGSEISLRDRAGGVPILAGIALPSGTSDVVTLGQGAVSCTERDTCRADGEWVAYELEVDAEPDVSAREGQPVDIQLGGQAYTFISHKARRRTGSQPTQCADSVRDERLWIEASLVMKDPQGLIDALPPDGE